MLLFEDTRQVRRRYRLSSVSNDVSAGRKDPAGWECCVSRCGLTGGDTKKGVPRIAMPATDFIGLWGFCARGVGNCDG